MSGQAKAYIAGIGMITPVGADTAMTAAAVWARVSGYQASRYYNQQSQRITMAGVPDEVFSSMQAEIDEDNGYSEQRDHTTPGAFRLPAARKGWAIARMNLIKINVGCACAPASRYLLPRRRVVVQRLVKRCAWDKLRARGGERFPVATYFHINPNYISTSP